MINRRQFIQGAVASWLACQMPVSQARIIAGDQGGEELALWPGLPPGGSGPAGSPELSHAGALRHISRPTLTLFSSPHARGKAVLIAAGGGYKRIEMAKEAWPAARWLQQQGYNAYVLSYRLPGEGWHDGVQVSLQDARRALRIIRSREKQLSVMGFSAGGHLLGMAVSDNTAGNYPHQDAVDDLPARADAAALIYPVISLEKPYTHTATHRMLVGPGASDQQNAAWSVERYVTPAMPPVFLAQAEDDPVSDPHNSLLMAKACEQAGVPVEMHLYRTGGHGFGMGKPGTPTVAWPDAWRHWIDKVMAG